MIDRSEIRGAVTGFALVAAFLLVAVSVNFGIPGQALLQTLRFHIAALLAAAAIVLVLAGGWRRAVGFALVLVVSVAEGGYFILRMQESRAEAAEVQRTRLLTVLSFNILGTNTANGAAIADFIKGSGADVVMVMEAAPLFPYRDELQKLYAGRAGCEEEQTCDLMLLARTPLGDVQLHSLGPYWRNRLITAATEIRGQRVNVVAVHMVKPYFDSASVAEAHVLNRILGRLDGPLLLAGDFNAAPWSDNIEWLIRTAGLLTAPTYPATWPVELGALGVPIDNVFTRAPLLIEELEATKNPMGSNHRGLLARIAIAGAE